MRYATDLPTVHDLDGLVDLVRDGQDLYVSWSGGPDLRHGLSATPLRIEPWWGSRSPRLWLARQLFDYRHLHGSGAWVLVGQEVGRGPDNEPLVAVRRPVAWIDDAVLVECEEIVTRRSRDLHGHQASVVRPISGNMVK
ncbi:MAG TPA: DUF6098 family protein [Pseudonocardiaceae bacterium]|nr:DUF6098 family protein [Pseudonocardiaceae bacterium]